jgi:transposase-like protein
MGEKNRHFSREFKRDAVQLVTLKIKSIKENLGSIARAVINSAQAVSRKMEYAKGS